jgi:hypothetical protein
MTGKLEVNFPIADHAPSDRSDKSAADVLALVFDFSGDWGLPLLSKGWGPFQLLNQTISRYATSQKCWHVYGPMIWPSPIR